MIGAISATTFLILIQFIRHYITDKAKVAGISRNQVTFVILQISETAIQLFYLSTCPYNSLRIYSFTTPGTQPKGVLLF